MSLSQPLEDLQYSFNSLYTPSYSIAGLVPIASPDEDFVPISPSSPKSSEPRSQSQSLKQTSLGQASESSISHEHKQAEPTAPHYQKLKMNYFRRLNVVPKSLEVTDSGSQKSGIKNKINKPSPPQSQKFIPSFAPSPARSSLPITIPSSKKPSRQHFREEIDRDGKRKSPHLAFSIKTEDTLDHFGVFDTDFEL